MTTASILVVEDEKIIAKSIEKHLKALGYAVTGLISTGEEAIRLTLETNPDPILMGINLGGGIGRGRGGEPDSQPGRRAGRVPHGAFRRHPAAREADQGLREP